MKGDVLATRVGSTLTGAKQSDFREGPDTVLRGRDLILGLAHDSMDRVP